MGGPGSGGRRAGAGRKKKPEAWRVIDGGADRRGPRPEGDVQAPAEDATVVIAPADLLPAERVVWTEWAPLAMTEKTLTKSTLAAFLHVVQLEVECRELDAALGIRRGTDVEPRPLLVMSPKERAGLQRLRLMVRKELAARLKDFKLAPFGKELLPGGAGEGEVDPLDAFTRKRG